MSVKRLLVAIVNVVQAVVSVRVEAVNSDGQEKARVWNLHGTSYTDYPWADVESITVTTVTVEG